MNKNSTYKKRGIISVVAGVGFIMASIGLGVPYLENNYDKITNKKVYNEFEKIENYYDFNRDGTLSIGEKYFMYSKFGLEFKPANYFPDSKEMKEIIQRFNELDNAQFGIFDSVHLKTLGDSL